MPVFWIKGLPNDNRVTASVNNRGKVIFSSKASINMFRACGQDNEGIQIILPGVVSKNPKPSLIVYEISNPETHSRALYAAAAELCGKSSCPVINHPELVLKTTREKVSEMLRGLEQLFVRRVLLIKPLALRQARFLFSKQTTT